MKQIGSLIKNFRTAAGMNRGELALDICSEKYVYLIEKGERTPSADIVNRFGERLGCDFFKFFPYLDCEDPIGVSQAINEFNLFRRKGAFPALKEASERTERIHDFQKTPWSYELIINRLCFEIFIEKKHKKALNQLEHILEPEARGRIGNTALANFYVLQAIGFQLTGALENAGAALDSARALLSESHHKIERYRDISTSIKISTMTLSYLTGDFKGAIKAGKDLLAYQNEINAHERTHYAFAYLAFSYHRLGLRHEAIAHFKKLICCLLLERKPLDMFYISSEESFGQLMQDELISPDMVCEFEKKYSPPYT
jgi:transcriptional regulator with XRE-family HTH domain